MNYNYNLVVRKTKLTEWTIYTEDGQPLHVLHNCTSKLEAEERAKVWASTWHSVDLRVIDEQEKH